MHYEPSIVLNSVVMILWGEMEPLVWKDPVADVRWVPLESVEENDYNPNVVAPNELKLLYLSILMDGYTQPVVTYHDSTKNRYIIVDGYHRYLVMKYHANIRERTKGLLPVVVLEKTESERMASTIRHNRARGKHRISGMANVVFSMLDKGVKDEAICADLGLEADELIRLKHVTGFAKLFENAEYKRSWETRRQIRIRRDYAENPAGFSIKR